jgi:hypothetical protein
MAKTIATSHIIAFSLDVIGLDMLDILNKNNKKEPCKSYARLFLANLYAILTCISTLFRSYILRRPHWLQ